MARARDAAITKAGEPLALLGAGAQARETLWVIDDLRASGGAAYRAHCMTEDLARAERPREVHGVPVYGWEHLGDREHPRRKDGTIAAIVAVGSSKGRETMVGKARELPLSFVSLIHPSVAAHHRRIALGEGSVVAARAAISTDVTIGKHVLINLAVTISHDCQIGDFTSLAPGVHVAGHVSLGRGVEVGVGASIINEIEVGDGATIGAQSCVIEDVPARATVAGVPARVIKRPS